MNFLLWTFVLVMGSVVLVKGADILVEGGGKTAAHFGVPAIIIGLTLFSFGSTLPELASSITAATKGRGAIPIGNVVGSNIANILLVLGASAMVRPIKIKRSILKREIPMLFVAMFLLVIFGANGNISGVEGIILLCVLISYLAYLFVDTYRSPGRREAAVKQTPVQFKKNITIIVIGIIGVIIGAELIIRAAEFYIVEFGISEGIVGLSIIALGTSLPELVTAVTASRRGEGDISLGNVIGANIYNILLVLGICAFILPLDFSYELYISVLIMMVVTGALALASFTNRTLSRVEGALMVTGYVIYVIYLYVPL